MKPLHAVHSSGPRILFLVTAALTVGLLPWTLQMSDHPGLTPIFTRLFADQDYVGARCMLLILVIAAFLSPYVPARAVLQFAGNHAVAIALCSAVLLAAGTLFVYHDHPLSMDEYAAYFQSQVFAAGHLHGQFPPGLLDWLIPRGFQDYFLNVSPTTGAVSETYWPGFALLLTPFTWAGVPWLCNPVISAATLIVIHRIALDLFADREAAGLALLLTLASPVIFANGISYYSMPAHLLANSLYVLLLMRPNVVRAAAAGVVGSLALSLHNPVPHLLFALPWLIWLAARGDRVKVLAAIAAGYLPLCMLLGVGWFLFSTQLLASGDVIQGALPNAAPDRLQAMLAIFTPPSAAVWLARAIGMAKVWVWAVPGLLVLAAVGAVRWRHDPLCRLLAASALLTVVGYFFVPVDQGHGWGYRYFHSAWVALPLLATAALFPPAVGGPLRDAVHRAPGRFESSDTKTYVTTLIILTFFLGIGLRAWQIDAFIARDLRQAPPCEGSGPCVVIIDPSLSFYGVDLVQNDPWLRGPVTRMLSHGAAADVAMMGKHYPGLRRVYGDYRGSVWSAQPTDVNAAAGSARRGGP